MQTTVPYGRKRLEISLGPEWSASEIRPNPAQPLADPEEKLRAELAQLPREVANRLTNAASVAIAVNDKTRPVPHDRLLPPLLDYLIRLGVPPERVTFLVATGAHPPMRPEEFSSILPERVIATYRVISHDAKKGSELESVGATSRGTPAVFNRRYLEAGFRIVVGNIEPHQFMGFSGGAKSASVGLAGMATINSNHSMMVEPGCRLGEYDGNPARQDVEELGRLLQVDLAVNAVLNDDKKPVDVLCGDPLEVMRRGIPIVRRQFEVPVDGLFDLTISSPGGHPKDINLYQAQKALAHAALITRPNGTIVVVAACPEGTGSGDYEEWVRKRASNVEVLERFRSEGFRVGPHKAFQIARDVVGRKVYLVSEMDAEFVRGLLLSPSPSVEAAVAEVLESSPQGGRAAVLPYANATMPVPRPSRERT